MIIVGLTGSIAMGKSTVTQMFADEQIPVTNADSIVHRLLAEDEKVKAEIKARYPQVFTEGAIDRRKLGAIAFDDSAVMQWLESLLHPKVRATEMAFILREQKQGAWMVVLDIPLLFETGADARVDKVVVVTAPPAVQRERVMQRPGMSEEKFRHILARQMPDAEKRKRADYLVETHKGLEHSRLAVQQIIAELREKK